MTKKMGVNAALNLFKTALSIIFPLITYPYISRILGVENLGKINYTASIVGYFSLIAALGISTYTIREGGRIRSNSEKLSRLGNLPADKVQYYYNICDVFVLPSRFEAFGIVFVEALCYGLPCIGRNLMEMPNLIQNNETGLLIPAEEENP